MYLYWNWISKVVPGLDPFCVHSVFCLRKDDMLNIYELYVATYVNVSFVFGHLHKFCAFIGRLRLFYAKVGGRIEFVLFFSSNNQCPAAVHPSSFRNFLYASRLTPDLRAMLRIGKNTQFNASLFSLILFPREGCFIISSSSSFLQTNCICLLLIKDRRCKVNA